MTAQNYLMINKETNIVENICLWDGNVDTWTPPNEYLILLQETYGGSIGDSWDGTAIVPKPEPEAIPSEPQPQTQGTQTL